MQLSYLVPPILEAQGVLAMAGVTPDSPAPLPRARNHRQSAGVGTHILYRFERKERSGK